MFELELFLNKSITRDRDSPLYRQIYNAIRKAILERFLPVGTKLPSTRFISEEISVSRNTVMTAFDQLIAEGYLITKSGSGTYVADQLPDELLEARMSFSRRKREFKSRRKTSRRSDELMSVPLAFGSDEKRPRAFRPCFSAIDEFPLEAWIRCFSKSLRKMARINLDYGDTKGYLPLRESIAKYLGGSRGVRCDAEQILIVSGSQQGLDISARVLLDENDKILVEDPGYVGARGAFSAAGVIPVSVPVNDEGIDIQEGSRRSENARAVYVTPSHQFPLGVVMSLSRRLEILDWAKSNSRWIIEDDYDSEFRYDGKPLSALQGLDNYNRVIYLGTFSKVLFPSLRLGYMVVPKDIAEKFERVLSFTTSHSSLFEQLALTDFINQGQFSSHIRRMRGIYQERQSVLVESANKHLGDFLEIEPDEAGMHVIGWLKNGLNDKAVAEFALKRGLYTAPVSYQCISEKIPDGLILSYAGLHVAIIEESVIKLRDILHEYSRKD